MNDKEDFFKSRNKSFFIYKYALILFVTSSLILLLIGKFYNYIGVVSFFVSILFLIAILLDLFFIVRLFWGKLYAKIIYLIIGYFAYIEATVIAKKIVYINTGINPDSLQSSIDYLAGWLLIPAWLTYISIFLLFFGFIIIILQFILMIFQDFQCNFLQNIFDKFNLPFESNIEKKLFLHISFFLCGIATFNYYSNKIILDVYTYSTNNIIKKKIKDKSYFINNGFICNNKEIKNDDYIKIIGDNIVSIVRIDDKNEIKFYKEMCNY